MIIRNVVYPFLLLLFSFSLSLSQELLPEKLFEEVEKSVVVIYSYDNYGNKIAQGSGVVFDEEGFVVTNFHVLGDGVDIKVQHYNKSLNDISVVGFDELKDVMVLKIPKGILPSLKIADTARIRPGQRIYAIGSPLGLENSISEGVISGLRYSYYTDVEYIQISAPVSHGSSGGAVVNSSGELVGISTWVIKDGQNLNFAIKVNDFINLKELNLSVRDAQCISLYNKGVSFYKDNKYNDAYKCYSKYIKLKDGNKSVYLERAKTLYELTKFREAIKDLNIAINLDPTYVEAYYQRALMNYEIGDYERSIRDCNKILELDPNANDIYYYRGLNFIFNRQSSEAVKDLSVYIKYHPNNEKAHNYLGLAYSKLKKYEEAIECISKAIELNYKYAEAYYNRAEIYLTIKQFNKSIADNSRAIELNPNYTLAYISRGTAYYHANKKEKACSDLRKARYLGSEEANRLLKAFCD